MTRRLLAGPLWFIAVSSLVTFAETLLGQPRQFGAVIGVLMGALVMVDPLHWFWPVRASLAATSMPTSAFQTSAK